MLLSKAYLNFLGQDHKHEELNENRTDSSVSNNQSNSLSNTFLTPNYLPITILYIVLF